jgi:hypothetical protein
MKKSEIEITPIKDRSHPKTQNRCPKQQIATYDAQKSMHKN